MELGLLYLTLIILIGHWVTWLEFKDLNKKVDSLDYKLQLIDIKLGEILGNQINQEYGE